VESCATQLGLNLRVFRDLHALPVVLFYLRAPLPAHWVERPPRVRRSLTAVNTSSSNLLSKVAHVQDLISPRLDSKFVNRTFGRSAAPPNQNYSRDQVQFINDLTGDIDPHHPLRSVFTRLAKIQVKQQHKSQRRAEEDGAPEAWMEFVEPSGSPYYFCFLTQKREYEFPPLVPTQQLGMQLIKTAKDTHAQRLHQRLASRTVHLTPASLEAMKLNIEAEQRSKTRRAALLCKMPLSMVQITATAQYLGLEPMTQNHLMWVASAALCDTMMGTLPVGWQKCKQRGGSNRLPVYYHNQLLRVSQWEHPSLSHWRSLLHELQSIEQQHIAQDFSFDRRGSSDVVVRPEERRRSMIWVEADDRH